MPKKSKLKNIKEPFTADVKVKDKINSAINIALSVVELDILEQHKKKILTEVQWLISEANGKYKTKYRTKESLNDKEHYIHHEHVFQRKKVTLKILNDTRQTKKILKNVIGCLVTVNEHEKLNAAEKKDPSLYGWERYKKAGIQVYDMECAPPKLLKM